jgi:hypothetical protein
MSLSNDSTSTTADGRASLSSTFLEFCAKVRKNDPSILPEFGNPFRIRYLSEIKSLELADALLENTCVTYLELETNKYTKCSAEAMAKYVRTSKRLQRIHWRRDLQDRREFVLQHREEILCCFLSAIQESTSLKELQIDLPLIGGPSTLALEFMLTHTQSLRHLSLLCPVGVLPVKGRAVAAARSGLTKNTTLRELTLEFSLGDSSTNVLHFDKSAQPSYPSKAMFAWAYGESDWTPDCAAKRYLQNRGT